MTSLMVGNPARFAIESGITKPYAWLGQLALGYFVVHLGGSIFGVRSNDATMLGSSFEEVSQRVARRGTHVASFGADPDARKIVDAFRAATYEENRQGESFFGMSGDEFRDLATANKIVWAPDGDEAFDDGSHVLHFDQGDRVRLIAFKNHEDPGHVARSVVDQTLGANEFYDLLDQWRITFERDWDASLKRAH
jgi:hypothetical protein